MIDSAAEFRRLRTSSQLKDYQRAAFEDAPESVWLQIIETDPELRVWVAYNKTVSLSILRLLARDPDPSVRRQVASRRKLDEGLFESLSRDEDEGVRMCIATNPKVPASILARLTSDPASLVAERAGARREKGIPRHR